MKISTKMLVIAKDDFPLEMIKGRPITNFIRRILHAKHLECHTCYEQRKGIEVFRDDATTRSNGEPYL